VGGLVGQCGIWRGALCKYNAVAWRGGDLGGVTLLRRGRSVSGSDNRPTTMCAGGLSLSVWASGLLPCSLSFRPMGFFLLGLIVCFSVNQRSLAQIFRALNLAHGIFFIFILSRFCKNIYDPSQILQKYTSTAVAHGVKDITPRAHDGKSREEWALSVAQP
jgi:hypothetical protein